MDPKSLQTGYFDVPCGCVAAVVTCLEMTRTPDLASPAPIPDLTLVRILRPTATWYRVLFREIGEPWLWFSRLTMDTSALESIILDPAVHVYAVRQGSLDIGLLELDFRTPGQCELAFLGLKKDCTGRGFGKWLMELALAKAWAQPIQRLWVHTCTLDAPEALGFYQRHGFVPYQRQIEIAPDPRLTGIYSPTLRSDFPIL